MTTIEIKDKQIYDAFGTVKATAKKAQVMIHYEVGQPFANGSIILMDEDNKICTSFNQQLPTEGWGEDDTFIINKLLQSINVTKK